MRAALAFLELSSPLVFLLALKRVDSLLRFIMLDFSTYTRAFLPFVIWADGHSRRQSHLCCFLKDKSRSHTPFHFFFVEVLFPNFRCTYLFLTDLFSSFFIDMKVKSQSLTTTAQLFMTSKGDDLLTVRLKETGKTLGTGTRRCTNMWLNISPWR